MGKQFLVCAKCGHKYIDWIRKEAIEEGNKVLKRTFDKKLAEFNEKKKRGSKSPQWSSNLSSSAAIATSTSIPVTQALARTTVATGPASFAIARVPLLLVPPTTLR